MRQNLHAPFALLFAALLLAGPAAARPHEPDTSTSAQASEMESLATGSIAPSREERLKRRFDDCMAIWEPATHMTKPQWERTCHSQLDEIPNL